MVSFRSVTETSNWIWDWANSLLSEMVPTAPEANGSSTLLTCLTYLIALIWLSMADLWSLIGPDLDWNTSCPVVPEAWGKR